MMGVRRVHECVPAVSQDRFTNKDWLVEITDNRALSTPVSHQRFGPTNEGYNIHVADSRLIVTSMLNNKHVNTDNKDEAERGALSANHEKQI
jgi:hypothetical protein